MHKGTRHVGKVPESLRQSRDLSDRLKLLQKKLAKAIEEEDFEEAAILRDEIKQTTARRSQSGSDLSAHGTSHLSYPAGRKRAAQRAA